MKRLILLFLISIPALSFQEVQHDPSVYTITLPKGAQKISRNQVPPERDTLDGGFVYKMNLRGDFYKIETTTFLQLWSYKTAPPGRSPEEAKRVSDQVTSYGKNPLPKYSNELKAINNYTARIETFEMKYNAYYRFYAGSKKAPYFLNGTIQFKVQDRVKVKMMLDELLKSLKFNDHLYHPPMHTLPEAKVSRKG